jgi:hypothetical protein
MISVWKSVTKKEFTLKSMIRALFYWSKVYWDLVFRNVKEEYDKPYARASKTLELTFD